MIFHCLGMLAILMFCFKFHGMLCVVCPDRGFPRSEETQYQLRQETPLETVSYVSNESNIHHGGYCPMVSHCQDLTYLLWSVMQISSVLLGNWLQCCTKLYPSESRILSVRLTWSFLHHDSRPFTFLKTNPLILISTTTIF